MSLPLPLSERYQVQRLLGSGGFGQVYLARDRELQREVALKLLDARFEDPHHLERFREEARITSGLRHPHIVTLFDFGVLPQHAYIVYDYVPGRDLEAVLASDDPLPLARITLWGRKISEALEVAHQQGVVHRDLKPANVLIREGDGEPLLCDFGIARRGSGQARTREGMILGTPAYVAPEIWDGAPPGPLSDQWAWAATLFELTYGEAVQPLHTPQDIWQELQDGWTATIPRAQKGRFPTLETILLRALANDPGERFPDMAHLGEALARPAARRPSRLSRTWPSRRRRPGPASPRPSTHRRAPSKAPGPPRGARSLLLVGLLSLLVGLGFTLTPAPERQPPTPRAPELPRADQEARDQLLRSLEQLREDPARGRYPRNRLSWEEPIHMQHWMGSFLDPRLDLRLGRYLDHLLDWFRVLDRHGLWEHPEVTELLGEQILPFTLGYLADLERFSALGVVILGEQLDISQLGTTRPSFIRSVAEARVGRRKRLQGFLGKLSPRSSGPDLPREALRTGLGVLLAPDWSPELVESLDSLLALLSRPGAAPFEPALGRLVRERSTDLLPSDQACDLRGRILERFPEEVPEALPLPLRGEPARHLDRLIARAELGILHGTRCGGPSQVVPPSLHGTVELLGGLVETRPDVARPLVERLFAAFFLESSEAPRPPGYSELLERIRSLRRRPGGEPD